MSKEIFIGGTRFEVKVPRKNKLSLEETIFLLDRYAGRDLWDCYERPSRTKELIYEMWLNWYTNCDDAEVDYFGVSGYNSMQFTLQGLAFIDGNYYELRITACHNYAILIELD